jgi:hypothetical protein
VQLAIVDRIATDITLMPRYRSGPMHVNDLMPVNHRLEQLVGCPDPNTTGVNIQIPHTPSVTTRSVSAGSNAPETRSLETTSRSEDAIAIRARAFDQRQDGSPAVPDACRCYPGRRCNAPHRQPATFESDGPPSPWSARQRARALRFKLERSNWELTCGSIRLASRGLVHAVRVTYPSLVDPGSSDLRTRRSGYQANVSAPGAEGDST